MTELERMYCAELKRRFEQLGGGTITDEKKKVDMIIALDKQYQSHLDRDVKERDDEAARKMKEKEFELKKAQLEFDKKKYELEKLIKESEAAINDRKIAMEESKNLTEEQIKREEISLKRDQLDLDKEKITMEKENTLRDYTLRKEELDLRKEELDSQHTKAKKDRLITVLDVVEKVIGVAATTAATLIGIHESKKLVEMGYGFEYADLGIKRSQTFKDLSRSAMRYL